MTKKENSALDSQLKALLSDTAFQRGLTWRNQKVNAVAEARRRGIPEEDIFRELKRAGLIDATAKAIMRDAFYLEDSEISIIPKETTPHKQSGIHPCWNCSKAIPLNLNFCSELCAKEYGGKKKKAQ